MKDMAISENHLYKKVYDKAARPAAVTAKSGDIYGDMLYAAGKLGLILPAPQKPAESGTL